MENYLCILSDPFYEMKITIFNQNKMSPVDFFFFSSFIRLEPLDFRNVGVFDIANGKKNCERNILQIKS